MLKLLCHECSAILIVFFLISLASPMMARIVRKIMKPLSRKTKIVSSNRALRGDVFRGKAREYGVWKSKSGLKKKDLKRNKKGRIVSTRQSSQNKENLWVVSTQVAREFLGLKGWHPVKKGTALYDKSKQVHMKKKHENMMKAMKKGGRSHGVGHA
jgi:hypothetical protein